MGLFSNLGRYAEGVGYGASARGVSMLSQSGQAGFNAGQLGRGIANWGGSTLAGAAAGGAWGMASDDTSVIGGALMGAGAGRYGTAGVRMAMRGPGAGLNRSAWNNLAGRMAAPGMRGYASMGAGYAKSYGRGVYGQMRRDARSLHKYGSTLRSNLSTAWGNGLASNK